MTECLLPDPVHNLHQAYKTLEAVRDIHWRLRANKFLGVTEIQNICVKQVKPLRMWMSDDFLKQYLPATKDTANVLQGFENRAAVFRNFITKNNTVTFRESFMKHQQIEDCIQK